MFAHITRISDLSKETIYQVVESDDLDQLQALLKHLEKISVSIDDNVDKLIQLLTLTAEQSTSVPYGISVELIPAEGLDGTEIEIHALNEAGIKNEDVLHCQLVFATGFSAFAKAIFKLSASVPKQDLTAEVELIERGHGFQPGKRLIIQRGKDKPPLSTHSRLVGVPSSRQPNASFSRVPETSRETPHARTPVGPNQLPTVPRMVRQSGVVPTRTSTEEPVSVPIPSHGIRSIGLSASPGTTRPAVPRPTPKKQANET